MKACEFVTWCNRQMPKSRDLDFAHKAFTV